MKWLPDHPVARAAVAILAAAAVIAWLHRMLQVGASARAPSLAALPAVSPVESLGFRIVAVAGCVWLVAPGHDVPPTVAPVFEVFADGAVALRRAPPVSPVPEAAGTTAAILLPASGLAELGAAARATTLELLANLRAERPLSTAAVELHGVEAARPRLAAWLAWAP